MTGAPAWVSVGTPLPRAHEVLLERGIRHHPVLDGEALVGILSDRNLKEAFAAPGRGNFLVEDVMMPEGFAVRVG